VRIALTQGELAAKMRLQFSLGLRDRQELERRVERGEILSRAALEAYLPKASDYSKVRDWLIKHGFEIELDANTRHAIFVRGSNALISSVLGVKMARVLTVDGEFTSATTPPSLPEEIAGLIDSIKGLQPHIIMHRHQAAGPPAVIESTWITPAAVAAAYETPENLDGSGQTIAIVADAIPYPEDLANFWTLCGIPQSLDNFTVVSVSGGTNHQGDPEVSQDVEWSSGLAPGANIRLYAVPFEMCPASQAAAFAQILNDLPSNPTLHQVTISYGMPESLSDATGGDAALTLLAAQGVTCFASSGDAGSNPNPSDARKYLSSAPLAVEYPASDPHMTAVGGTTLVFDQEGQVSTQESAWSVGVDGGQGTGGGKSIVFPRPTWQVAPGVPSDGGRCVPDVSAMAGYGDGLIPLVVCQEGTISPVSGGTSLSSPIWAGLAALINQARSNSGLSPVGFLNPKLYPAAGSGCFTDIVSGFNGAYLARSGYDFCTGIGTPKVSNLVGYLSQVTVSTDFDNWSWSNPLPEGNDLSGVASNGSLLVTVGAGGTILTSADGASWSAQFSGTASYLRRVIWTGTEFIAVGEGGTILTSPDGKNWTAQSSGTTVELSSVVWTGTQFVAVGNSDQILTSPDGRLWTEQSSGTSGASLFGVAFNGSQLVAVGTTIVGGDTFEDIVVTSTDGITWINRSSSMLGQYLKDVMWDGTQFVVVGAQVSLSSPDGNTWAAHSAPATLDSLAWNGEIYVAVGNSGEILTSSDGIAWLMTNTGGVSTPLNGVAWTGSQFVAVGDAGTILTSLDGQNWTMRSAGSEIQFNSVAWGANQFVAVGNVGTIYTSSDGQTWTARTSGIQYWNLTAVAWNGSQFVVTGTGGTLLTSVDGVAWTVLPSVSFGAPLFGLVWNGAQFVAVGLGGAIYTSPDGTNWTNLGLSGNALLGVCWGAGQFVAVGDLNTILTSPDGIVWSSQNSNTTGVSFYGVASNGNRFVAVGGGGAGSTGSCVILTSVDGVSWTRQDSGTQSLLLSIIWSGSEFIAVGWDGVILTSRDGTQWTNRKSASAQPLDAIAWNGQQLVVVGYLGAILTSQPRINPTVTWPDPNAITYGTALSSAQLDATASVPGTFTYMPALGTVLNVGTHTLSAIFTPSDSADYNSASTTTTLSVTPTTAARIVSDFNGDGKPDVLWTNTATGDRAIWYLDGTTIADFGYLAGIPTDWHIVGTGDFDGDGQTDLVWENTATGDRTFWLMSGIDISSFGYLAFVDPVWHIAAIGDFDGDGKPDVVWENSSTGDRAVWFLDGTAIGSFGYIAGIAIDWHIVGAADFDGDGQTDLVWENLVTGDRTVWYMNGPNLKSFGYIANIPGAWHIAMVADFDGDGHPDLLWENTSTGDRAIWILADTTLTSTPYLAYVDPVWQIAP
jgi:hypothetical protein